MSAVVLDIADAVAAAINAATLSQPITAERAYAPIFELPDLVDLKVTVVPVELAFAALTRSSDDFDYVVDIGITQRCEPTPAAADPLMMLAQEILDLFRGKRLVGYTDAKCVAGGNRPIYDATLMDTDRVFMSVVNLTFRMARDQT